MIRAMPERKRFFKLMSSLIGLNTFIEKIRTQMDWADGASEQNVGLTGRVDNPKTHMSTRAPAVLIKLTIYYIIYSVRIFS